MSIASISYGSIKNAASEARDVAKKLDKYANTIDNSVYKKLNKYDGPWTGNISSARSKANAKIDWLREEAGRYRDYADDLDNLKEECERVDKAVKSKVSSLTASFKETHGINNNVVINTISYLFTSVTNSTSTGRWMNTQTDAFETEASYHKQAIEDWYDYNGGKQLITGIAVAALEIAIAVAAIVLSGGAVLVVVATVIGSLIAIANGVCNIVNEVRAYNLTQDGDPATGKRRSDQDTIQDTLRNETDSKFWHNVATGIDFVNIACAVIQVFSAGKELLQKGYKWATGSVDDLSRIKVKDLFSKDFFKGIGSKFDDFKTAYQYGGWDFMKQLATNTVKRFGTNLKLEYFTKFDLKTAKSYMKIGKTLLKDGFTFAAICEFVIGPGLTLGEYTTAKIDGGKISVDFGDITFGDFYDLADDFSTKIIGSDLFSNNTIIDNAILDQLSKPIDINISIPETVIPAFSQACYV